MSLHFKRLFIEYPREPYTNVKGNARMRELGYTGPLEENVSRDILLQRNVVLGKNMEWGIFHDNMATLHYHGSIPKGVYIDLQKPIDQGVISEWYLGER